MPRGTSSPCLSNGVALQPSSNYTLFNSDIKLENITSAQKLTTLIGLNRLLTLRYHSEVFSYPPQQDQNAHYNFIKTFRWILPASKRLIRLCSHKSKVILMALCSRKKPSSTYNARWDNSLDSVYAMYPFLESSLTWAMKYLEWPIFRQRLSFH